MEKTGMKGAFRLGRIAGIEVFLHWTFFLLVIYVLASQLMQGGTWHAAWLWVLLVTAVFATVVLHELGHALMARRFGFSTRDIVLLPIGGVARMEKLPVVPWQEILVAVAGPAVNAVLALLTWYFFLRGPFEFDVASLNALTSESWMRHFFYTNVALVVFHLCFSA